MNNNQKLSPEYLQKQMAGARSSLLTVLIFTVVNLVLLLLDTDRYFLFSASVPYFLTLFGMGMDFGLGYTGIGAFTLIALAISAVVLVLYLLCWLLSKKYPGWLIAALVLFILDTLVLVLVCLLAGALGENIMDFLFHGWVIVELIQAISANAKLKKLAAQGPAQASWQQTGPEF